MPRVRGTVPDGFQYPIGATFPAPYPISDDAMQRGYCRLWGLAFAPRVRPEVPVTRRPHPRSYKPEQSSAGLPTRYLHGQQEMFR